LVLVVPSSTNSEIALRELWCELIAGQVDDDHAEAGAIEALLAAGLVECVVVVEQVPQVAASAI